MSPDARTSTRSAWWWVALWTLFIYITIPLARRLQAWVELLLGRDAFLYAVLAAIVLGLLGAGVRLLRRPFRPSFGQWGVLGLVALVYGLGAWRLRANPEEAMHFVQYGVLSVLLYRAFLTRHANTAVYAAAFFLGGLLGMLDEVIQWATPRRFFDFRDMAINIFAVGLMQVAIAAGIRPVSVARAPNPATARLALRLCGLMFLAGLVLVSATPGRVDAVLTALGMPRMDEPLIEYGQRIEDPDLGHFPSRLTRDQLREQDAARSAEVGDLMRAYPGAIHNHPFFSRFQPYADPFVYEMSIYTFRRDRYERDAHKHDEQSRKHDQLLAVAHHENMILERYFGASLRAAGLAWDEPKREHARRVAGPHPFVPQVARHLVTRFRERQWQAFMLAGLLVVGLALRYAVPSERKRS